MDKKIENILREYETAFSKLDFKKISEFYADSFMSAGPKGIIAQSKQDFIKMAEKASGYYKSVGQKSAKLLSKKEIPISDNYTMVTTHWGAEFEKTGDKLIEFDVSYIFHISEGNEPKIIMFIAHQDEEEAMKKLKLV